MPLDGRAAVPPPRQVVGTTTRQPALESASRSKASWRGARNCRQRCGMPRTGRPRANSVRTEPMQSEPAVQRPPLARAQLGREATDSSASRASQGRGRRSTAFASADGGWLAPHPCRCAERGLEVRRRPMLIRRDTRALQRAWLPRIPPPGPVRSGWRVRRREHRAPVQSAQSARGRAILWESIATVGARGTGPAFGARPDPDRVRDGSLRS